MEMPLGKVLVRIGAKVLYICPKSHQDPSNSRTQNHQDPFFAAVATPMVQPISTHMRILGTPQI